VTTPLFKQLTVRFDSLIKRLQETEDSRERVAIIDEMSSVLGELETLTKRRNFSEPDPR
jgi:hypothetical protein